MKHATLVILPGWGGSHKTWADFVALAKPHFKDVQVINLPCFGNEPCPDSVWGVEEYANFVKSKIENQNSKIVLLGHSFGGAIATHIVATGPNIIDKLILSGAAVYRPKNYVRRSVFWLLAKIGKIIFSTPPLKNRTTFAKKLLYRSASSPDYAHTDGIKRKIFKKIIRQDQSHLLSSIQVPTCVIHGTMDTYVPMHTGKRIAQNIPNALFFAIDNGTHGLHIKHAQHLLSLILQFLD